MSRLRTVLVAASFAALSTISCGQGFAPAPTAAPTPAATEAPTPTPAATPAPKPTLSALALGFDGDRALEDVKKQVSFGPRIPDTPGHERQIEWMMAELKAAGFEVELRPEGTFTPSLTGREVPVFNIVAKWNTSRARRLFFSAHFDTRPYSDSRKSTVAERDMPVPGANDAGSGVAVLLGMARAIQKNPPKNVGIFLVFHDCEDLGTPSVNTQKKHPYQEFAVGAERSANSWKAYERFEAGVNFDMVGEALSPRFEKEQYSVMQQPALVEEFWGIGLKHFPDVFSDETFGIITDDHVPYLVNQLPVINLIDLEFEEWHTPRDLPDKVSAETMRKVGMTALEFISLRDSKTPEKP